MFKFKQTFPTPKEHTPGANTCEYIVLHHTGTGEGTIKGVIGGLYRRPDYASAHFIVDTNGDCYKLGQPTDILWHAGKSAWKGRTNMNRYSIGIEVIGPLKDGGFTREQKVWVQKLVQHLMAVCKIPKENVITHKLIAPKRKWDISDTFWNKEYKTFFDWQAQLIPLEQK